MASRPVNFTLTFTDGIGLQHNLTGKCEHIVVDGHASESYDLTHTGPVTIVIQWHKIVITGGGPIDHTTTLPPK